MSNIRKAGPRDYPMLIGLSGPGGSGKTYSALLLAKHLADGKPIGMVDTEDGRGERYYRQFDYLYLQLTAPYSPEAYVKAMDEMRAAGVAAMVVDSASHEWEGEGGCLEIHHEVTGGRDAQNMIGWAKVKPRHRRFIGYAKSTGIHTILCFQAREKSKPNPDRNAPPHAKIINLGWQPVSNASDAFEFTLFGMFQPGGEGTLTEDPALVKTFVDFREAWKPGMKITPAICQKLVALHRQSCTQDAQRKPAPIQKAPASDPTAAPDVESAQPPTEHPKTGVEIIWLDGEVTDAASATDGARAIYAAMAGSPKRGTPGLAYDQWLKLAEQNAGWLANASKDAGDAIQGVIDSKRPEAA